ncbi:MAG TPA: OsmC family protein [Polyangiaceae bacterium]|nr:OsmC family protein [Polyangiaceae bacterium]
MSEHRTRIEWQRTGDDFSLASFSRNHEVSFGTGQSLKLSATEEYRGDANRVNPEELLVSALSSCHMMTFLALAARGGLLVDQYSDDAVGYLEKDGGGRLAVTRVILRPRVRFGSSKPAPEELRALHERAHRGCFIANSVKTEVHVELSEEHS